MLRALSCSSATRRHFEKCSMRSIEAKRRASKVSIDHDDDDGGESPDHHQLPFASHGKRAHDVMSKTLNILIENECLRNIKN